MYLVGILCVIASVTRKPYFRRTKYVIFTRLKNDVKRAAPRMSPITYYNIIYYSLLSVIQEQNSYCM